MINVCCRFAVEVFASHSCAPLGATAYFQTNLAFECPDSLRTRCQPQKPVGMSFSPTVRSGLRTRVKRWQLCIMPRAFRRRDCFHTPGPTGQVFSNISGNFLLQMGRQLRSYLTPYLVGSPGE